MGLAASQARLLSITSRMSDNELRSQLISNAKMRLTSDSARVSDEYVAALNKTQLMFSNFDTVGNQMYQALTFNSLTAYSAYNNQYGIVNGAGEIFVSATDAANFNNCGGSLENFLKKYGLEKTTTYFDELKTSTEYNMPLYDEDGVATGQTRGIGYYDDNGVWQNIDVADTDILKAIYEGTVDAAGGVHYGQDATLNSVEYGHYEELVSDYRSKKTAYKNAIHNSKKDFISGTSSIKGITLKDDSGKNLKDLYSEFMTNRDTIKNMSNFDFTNAYNKYVESIFGSNVAPIKQGIATKLGIVIAGTKPNAKLRDDPAKDFLVKNDTTGNNLISNIEDYFDIVYNKNINEADHPTTLYSSGNAKFLVTTTKTTSDDGTISSVASVNTDASSLKFPNGSVKYLVEASSTDVGAIFNKDNQKYYLLQTSKPTNNIPYITVYDVGNYDEEKADRGYLPELPADTSTVSYSYETAYQYDEKVEDENGNITTVTKYTCQSDPRYTELSVLYDLKPVEANFVYNYTYVYDAEVKLDALQGVFEELLYNLENELNDTTISNNNADLKKAETEYTEAATKLAHFIWGSNAQDVMNTVTSDEYSNLHLIDYFDDPKWVLSNNHDNKNIKKTRTTVDPVTNEEIKIVEEQEGKVSMTHFNPIKYPTTTTSVDGKINYQAVKDLFILDCMMEHYGVPNYTWIDNNNPNEDGQAKATWYSNLFSRMQKGFQVIGDGLGKNQEWLQYAFESGLVHMEQVNKSLEWVSTMYSNCSSITESMVDVDVTLAEAKYKREMAKIEAKDKQYDMELKNIDTEHESLKQEYEVIKKVIGKNIERNFKLFQQA